MDMSEGNIRKQLLDFAMPLMVGLLFQQLYNTVDAIVVGQFVSKQAFAAVGSVGSIINILVGLCSGLSAGAGVVISQAYGTHDAKQLRDAVHTTMALTFITAALATAAGLFIVAPTLKMMGTPEDVIEDASRYLTIYFAGLSGLLVYNMGSGILRAVGDSRHPLFFLIFSALVNIVFDLLFVLVVGPVFPAFGGVAGVAYATIISQFLSAVLVLWTLSRTPADYGLRWKLIRLTKGTLGRIMALGLPSSVQQGLTAFSNVFVQSYINAFGSDCMAGWTGYNKLDIFLLIPLQGFALAITTFVGQNYGAGKLTRARDGVRSAMAMSTVITVALSAMLMLLAKPLLSLFNPDPMVLDYGSRFITTISPFYFTLCFIHICAGALRGIGRATAPTVIMLISFVAFRQVYLYVTAQMGLGFVAVSLAYPVGWVLCAVIMTAYYARCIRAEAARELSAQSA